MANNLIVNQLRIAAEDALSHLEPGSVAAFKLALALNALARSEREAARAFCQTCKSHGHNDCGEVFKTRRRLDESQGYVVLREIPRLSLVQSDDEEWEHA